MYFDESAWVALGFIIFIAIVWRKVGSALSNLLDNRVNKIKNKIEACKSKIFGMKYQINNNKKLAMVPGAYFIYPTKKNVRISLFRIFIFY